MIYKLTKTRKESCKCSNKYCDKFISRSEWAYTSSKLRDFCASCGKMENDYANEGMERPAV
jgi:hypothetical protein